MNKFIAKIGKSVPTRVKQLFGAAALNYGLWGANNSNKWTGTDTPPGRRSSSIIDGCAVLLVNALVSCRPIVVNAAGEEVPHEIVDMITRDFLAGILRNAMYAGNGCAAINETEDLVGESLAVLASSRLEIERKGTDATGFNVYTYTDISKKKITYTEDQVFHFKYQIDPDRPWMGRSPMTNVDNEILLDVRTTAYASGFMRRFGIPAWFLWPTTGTFTDKQRQAIQEDTTKHITGENSGGFGILPTQVGVTQLQGPRQFIDLADIRTQPEFRIAAQFGIPPVLAGLQAGYRFTTANSTLKEIRRHFADATVKPLADNIADELTKQVLPKFLFSEGLRVTFAFAESYLFARDIDAEAARVPLLAPIMTVDEGRELVGLPPLGDDRGSELIASMGQMQQQEEQPALPGPSNQLE